MIELLGRIISGLLTLKRPAANVISLRLQPNPFVGVKKLSLPPGFDRSYITIIEENALAIKEDDNNCTESETSSTCSESYGFKFLYWMYY